MIVRFDDSDFGQFLFKSGMVTEVQHMTLMTMRKETGATYLQCLRSKAYLDTEVQAQRTAEFIGGVYVDNSYDLRLHPMMYELDPAEIKRFRVIPVEIEENIGCLLTDPFDENAMQFVDRVFDGTAFVFCVASEFRFRDFIERNSSALRGGASSDGAKTIDEIHVKVTRMLEDAVNSRASDIHLFPQGDHGTLTFRIDGRVQHVEDISLDVFSRMIERLQDPSITEIHDTNPDVPRSGKTHVVLGGKERLFRINIEPSKQGLDCNLRIIEDSMRNIDVLGMTDEDKKKLLHLIELRQGMIIMTGPTGSGKSTTMYALLEILRQKWLNIFAIEDPVEYIVPGITQLDVDESKGISYRTAIESSLRHDPDVIVIGEMRSLAEALDAFVAANTGHLVFSTLHTNTAISAVARLATMGVDRYSICESLTAVVGQRLVRRVCPMCRESVEIGRGDPIRDVLGLGTEPIRIYQGKGCEKCRGTGYYDRVVITEIFRLTSEVRDMIQRELTTYELLHMVKQQGFKSMLDDAVEKMLAGITSLEEVMTIHDAML